MTNEEQNLLITYLVDLEEQFRPGSRTASQMPGEVRYKTMSSQWRTIMYPVV